MYGRRLFLGAENLNHNKETFFNKTKSCTVQFATSNLHPPAQFEIVPCLALALSALEHGAKQAITASIVPKPKPLKAALRTEKTSMCHFA
jgi:hypothetical protein